jgi:hypothetical protein
MTQPLPANNPVYKTSIFPNAVDQITNENAEVADAIMATQASLVGGGAAGTGLTAVSSGTVTATTSITVGTAVLRGGSGVPAAGLGANGDYYFRTDTPATANQRIYVKSAGAWVGIV